MKIKKFIDKVSLFDILALLSAIGYLYVVTYNVYDLTLSPERYSVDGRFFVISVILLALAFKTRKPNSFILQIITVTMLTTTTVVAWFGLSMG